MTKLKNTVTSITIAAILVLLPLANANAIADPKATGSVGYTAYSTLQRQANFDAHQNSLECTGFWNLDGTYVLEYDYLGSLYLSDMTVSGTTATGGYPSGGPYSLNWTDATVAVSGSTVTIVIKYTELSPPYLLTLTGTIAPDGKLNGTWEDNGAGTRTGTWKSNSGAATSTIVGCNGKGTFNYSDADLNVYGANINCVSVDSLGKDAWFSGPVVSGNIGAGQWVFVKVHDGGTPGRNGDQIWGSFVGQDPCILVAMKVLPNDGPFSIASGNLVVHS